MMNDPLLAEALNPRLALERRMAAEGQGSGAMLDPRLQPRPGTPATPATPATPQFFNGRQLTPQQKALQQQKLIEMLRARGDIQ